MKYIPFEEETPEIKTRVEDYWTERAESFFEQKQLELESEKADKWLREILGRISEAFEGREASQINILDVVCGAGFFTVLIGREGFNVTGIDLTKEMVEKAEQMIMLCGPFKADVRAMDMDAENLDFQD